MVNVGKYTSPMDAMGFGEWSFRFFFVLEISRWDALDGGRGMAETKKNAALAPSKRLFFDALFLLLLLLLLLLSLSSPFSALLGRLRIYTNIFRVEPQQL